MHKNRRAPGSRPVLCIYLYSGGTSPDSLPVSYLSLIHIYADGISRHKEVFPGPYYLFHGLIRHIGGYLCNPLIACVLDTEIEVGVVLYVIIIYGVIFTQMDQYLSLIHI